MKLLLLEDDARLASVATRGLRREGHAVDAVGTIEDARWFAENSAYDVLVFDVMLPDGDGFALCAELRARGDWTPVLLLTARDAVSDRVRGLDVGADDYLIKPFAFEELFARIRALSRRTATRRPAITEAGDLRLDPASRSVSVGDRRLDLTAREYALLEYFVHHADEALPRTRIIEDVWDWAFDGEPRIVDVYVRALRSHLGHGPRTPRIQTIRGVGYVLRVARSGSSAARKAS